jgi:hypothetical protein
VPAWPTVQLSSTGSATFLAEICYPALWVPTTVGPALIWSGLRPAGSGDDLPGTSGRIHRRPVFGGAAEERYGHTG